MAPALCLQALVWNIGSLGQELNGEEFIWPKSLVSSLSIIGRTYWPKRIRMRGSLDHGKFSKQNRHLSLKLYGSLFDLCVLSSPDLLGLAGKAVECGCPFVFEAE